MSAHGRKGEVSKVEVKFTRRDSKLTFLENLSQLLHQFQQAGKHSVLVILGCPSQRGSRMHRAAEPLDVVQRSGIVSRCGVRAGREDAMCKGSHDLWLPGNLCPGCPEPQILGGSMVDPRCWQEHKFCCAAAGSQKILIQEMPSVGIVETVTLSMLFCFNLDWDTKSFLKRNLLFLASVRKNGCVMLKQTTGYCVTLWFVLNNLDASCSLSAPSSVTEICTSSSPLHSPHVIIIFFPPHDIWGSGTTQQCLQNLCL